MRFYAGSLCEILHNFYLYKTDLYGDAATVDFVNAGELLVCLASPTFPSDRYVLCLSPRNRIGYAHINYVREV